MFVFHLSVLRPTFLTSNLWVEFHFILLRDQTFGFCQLLFSFVVWLNVFAHIGSDSLLLFVFFSLSLSFSQNTWLSFIQIPIRSDPPVVRFSYLSVTSLIFVPCRSLIFFCVHLNYFIHAPLYSDVALSQVFRERLKVLHSKITARNERIKLLMQRGSPDVDPLDSVET